MMTENKRSVDQGFSSYVSEVEVQVECGLMLHVDLVVGERTLPPGETEVEILFKHDRPRITKEASGEAQNQADPREITALLQHSQMAGEEAKGMDIAVRNPSVLYNACEKLLQEGGNQRFNVHLGGYTSSSGTSQYNDYLSARRCNTIKAWLEQRYHTLIESQQLNIAEIAPYGEKHASDSNPHLNTDRKVKLRIRSAAQAEQPSAPAHIEQELRADTVVAPGKEELPAYAARPSYQTASEELRLVLAVLHEKKYALYCEDIVLKGDEETMANFGSKLNIVGIRKAGEKATNHFDDTLCAFYEAEEKWVYEEYQVTTDPGWEKKTRHLPAKKRKEQSISGVAILKPGQYVNAYKVGLHNKKRLALRQSGGKVTVYRDADAIMDTTDVLEETGFFGINIHNTTYSTWESVFNWSEGCTVFQQQAEYVRFFQNFVATQLGMQAADFKRELFPAGKTYDTTALTKLVKVVKANTRNQFTYTLLKEEEVKKEKI